MPFVSKAQKRKFDELLEQGSITKEAYDRMAEDTPDELPDYGGYRPKVRRGPNQYNHIVKEEKPLG